MAAGARGGARTSHLSDAGRRVPAPPQNRRLGSSWAGATRLQPARSGLSAWRLNRLAGPAARSSGSVPRYLRLRAPDGRRSVGHVLASGRSQSLAALQRRSDVILRGRGRGRSGRRPQLGTNPQARSGRKNPVESASSENSAKGQEIISPKKASLVAHVVPEPPLYLPSLRGARSQATCSTLRWHYLGL